jgi:hypothetical protein
MPAVAKRKSKRGQRVSEIREISATQRHNGVGHLRRDDHVRPADAADHARHVNRANHHGAAGSSNGNDLANAGMPTVKSLPVIPAIRELHAQRRALMKTGMSLLNQCRAMARVALGFDPNADEKHRAAISAASVRIVDCINKSTPPESPDEIRVAGVIHKTVRHWLMLKDQNDDLLSDIESQLVKLAKQLPVAEWVISTHGVGIASLAAIVGEAGDLSNYSNPGKLWKRFGLHVAKGKAPSTWRKQGGLTAEEWVREGYKLERRAIAYNIGESFVKYAKNPCPYRDLYLQRKEYETPRVETKMHAHLRAMRYVTKRFFRELWKAWRV